MKQTLLSGSALLTSLLTVTAAPLWDLDFEIMTPGAPPPTSAAVAGAVNTQPQTVSNTAVNPTSFIQVVEDFSAHGHTLSGHSLVFQKSVSGGQEVALLGATTDYEEWSDYELRFDLLMGGGNSGQPLNVRLTTSNASVSVAGLTFEMNGTLILNSSLSSDSSRSFTGGETPPPSTP